ncbi:hypothetical protein BKA62DRAFT_614777 [Auriculariales sp. MPI-PUGE-AT-0066]|nr:hypothetical protein BKA62DRAFT_614777 [Auriculariales sp. MPI-PUGE-AT-0066]
MITSHHLLSHKPSQTFRNPASANTVGQHSAPFRHAYVRFSAAPTRIAAWRQHLELDELVTQLAPDERYARVLPHLVACARDLVRHCGWSDRTAEVDADQMAFALQKQSRGRTYVLAVPRSLSTFWECEDIFAQMFQAPGLFTAAPSRSRAVILSDLDAPLASMFYFLQVVVPGMCLVLMDETSRHGGVRRVARALPPSDWFLAHDHALCSALGGDYYLALVSRSMTSGVRIQTHGSPSEDDM